jgi:chromosome segregation ATPase
MTRALHIILCLIAMSWCVFSPAGAQEFSSPSAGPQTGVSGPNTFTIEQRALTRAQARLERELRQVRRCLSNAAQNLRDPQGNINRVASVDLVNCGRRLGALQRKLNRLGRSAERLQFEAAAAQAKLEGLLRSRAARARVNAASGDR